MGGVLQLWVAKFRSNSSFFDALMVKNESRRKKNGGEREGYVGWGPRQQGRKKGGSRAIPKMPSPTSLFVPSSVIFDTVSLLHNPS